MYTTILLAAALQDWERYSTHALAARDVAATLAKGAAQQLHVLSVYDYPPVETTDLPPELAVRHREDLLRRTDKLMVDKLETYVAPLRAEGVAVSLILRVGNPREVIVEVATSLKVDLLILGFARDTCNFRSQRCMSGKVTLLGQHIDTTFYF